MKASTTVEMLYIMPVFFLVFLVTIYSAFYYHDKCILDGAIHEICVAASLWDRQPDGVNEGEVAELFHQRVRGKLLLFEEPSPSISCGENGITIEASVGKGSMTLVAKGEGVITKPEEWIRTLRVLGKDKE